MYEYMFLSMCVRVCICTFSGQNRTLQSGQGGASCLLLCSDTLLDPPCVDLGAPALSQICRCLSCTSPHHWAAGVASVGLISLTCPLIPRPHLMSRPPVFLEPGATLILS